MQANNKRIFKNTLALYIRMFIILVVGLYTSRIVLQTLGATDYGIYNVVGGVVSMLTFLSNTMSSATQRFFSYEIGTNNFERLKQIFSASVITFLLFSVICLILAETIGVWFVNTKLNIPQERLSAALFVYQFSILTFIVSIIRVPYNALIIAREEMGFYAKLSIIETFLKLFIIYILVRGEIDKLKLYSILMFSVVLLVTIIYYLYCYIKFQESKLTFRNHRLITYKKLLSFSGWSLFGNIANMLMDQGVNILLNIFFGPIINTARGIAYQIKSQIMSFVGGFQTASNPQIIKYYSAGNTEEMKKLLFRSSKMSYYLLLLISLPIFLEVDYFLKLWLHDYPNWTSLFARLVILIVLVDSLSGCIIPAIQATGKIKWYQIKVGITKLLNLPICYVLFKLGFSPDYAMIVSIFLNFLCLFVRLGELKKHLGIKFLEYIRKVVIYDLLVTMASITIPIIIIISFTQKNIITFITIVTSSIFCTIISIIYIGLTTNERNKLINIIRRKNKHEY